MDQNNIYQLLAYLVVPVMLGYEFFMVAREERKGREEASVGAIVLDAFGVVFMGLVPAIFLFTLWALHSRFLPLQEDTIHRLQRYGVFFMFLGAWWQVYLYGALRSWRARKNEEAAKSLWTPFLGLGIFASIVVAWNFPWHLDLVSAVWFLILGGVLGGLKIKPKNVERVFWTLAAMTFALENVIFVWFNAIV